MSGYADRDKLRQILQENASAMFEQNSFSYQIWQEETRKILNPGREQRKSKQRVNDKKDQAQKIGDDRKLLFRKLET